MIFGAHLDSLTQEPLCVSSSSCNHRYSANAISSTYPQYGTYALLFSSGFPTAIFVISHPLHPALFPPQQPTPHFFPDSHASPINLPLRLLPAWADCQCLQVSCGHFSFIILSKSGMALAQGDWVSVKHQELIEFVLKWLIEGTLLMQS